MRGWMRLGIVFGAVLALVATNLIDATAQQCPKGKLRIYTSWPMQGAMIPEGTGMKNGVDIRALKGVSLGWPAGRSSP